MLCKITLLIGATLHVENCQFIGSDVNIWYDNSSTVTLVNNTGNLGTVVESCRDPTNVYLRKNGNNSNSCLDSIGNSCQEWDYLIANDIIVNEDIVNIGEGTFNASTTFVVTHDNYWSTFKYYFTGAGEETTILRDNLAEGSDLMDLYTTGIHSVWPVTYLTISNLTYYPYHGLFLSYFISVSTH